MLFSALYEFYFIKKHLGTSFGNLKVLEISRDIEVPNIVGKVDTIYFKGKHFRQVDGIGKTNDCQMGFFIPYPLYYGINHLVLFGS